MLHLRDPQPVASGTQTHEGLMRGGQCLCQTSRTDDKQEGGASMFRNSPKQTSPLFCGQEQTQVLTCDDLGGEGVDCYSLKDHLEPRTDVDRQMGAVYLL